MIYSDTIITKKGRELIAKLQVSGATTRFNSLVLGAGTDKLTEESIQLTDQRQEFEIDSAKQSPEAPDKIELTASPNNIGLESGYTIREMGIYAQDPDEGSILYAVINTEDNASTYDQFPAYSGEEDFTEIIFRMEMLVASTKNVEFKLSPENLRRQVMENTESIKNIHIEVEEELEENKRYTRETASSIQYDLAEVIFQLSVKDMTDNSMFKNVIVDKIDSDSAVNLIAGSYASGKVYI